MSLSHRPKKYLGQHFLTDKHILQKIIQSSKLKADDIVIEIGPGQGVLTQLMAPDVKKLICIETDRDLIEPLRSSFGSEAQIIHADFLQWDMSELPDNIKVIGNIPYYISTPIIEKLIANRSKISDVFLTVQLEFGQRLTALKGKEYGSLSCFAQYYADIKVLFKIKNTCFRPSPKVDSCFVHMKFKELNEDLAGNEEALFKMIQTAFGQRRKTIVNSLKGLAAKEKLEEALGALNINFNARPENLTLSNYIDLYKRLML